MLQNRLKTNALCSPHPKFTEIIEKMFLKKTYRLYFYRNVSWIKKLSCELLGYLLYFKARHFRDMKIPRFCD